MRRHRFDPLSLFAGLVFLAIAVVALSDGVRPGDVVVESVWPVVLILTGVGLLLTLVDRGDREPEPTAAPRPVLDLDPDLDPDRDLQRALDLVESGLGEREEPTVADGGGDADPDRRTWPPSPPAAPG